ncbi:ABC transporter permease [bacterium]|nr:ABC transporter permease [bacterium]
MKILCRKLSYTLFTIFLILTCVFFAIRLTPGDPVLKILGPEAKMEQIELYREQLGLNKSLFTQYTVYIKGIVTLDFGKSLFQKKEVWDLLRVHMPPTIIIAIFSVLFSSILGVFIGVVSAINKSSFWDHGLRLFSLLCLAFPIFSLGPLLVLVFAIKLRLLPVSEWGELRHMILPILTLTLPLSSILARVTRNKFLEEKKELWVTVLSAKGLFNTAIYLRVLKICLPTILNIMALQLSVVLAGTMITESIFDIPGMGLLLFEAIQNRDYPVVGGVIIYSTIIYMGVYFVVDLVNEYLDPRLS